MSARPNIILVVTDDQNAGTIAHMPALQRHLVERGTSFTRAFATTPLCCPARATLLRGQYAHNHGVTSNDGLDGGFPKFHAAELGTSTLATWLQGAGYRTALVGKYFNAYPRGLKPPPGFRPPGETYVPPGWSKWNALLDIPKDKDNNPYEMNGYRMNKSGRVVHYGGAKEDYQTDVLSRLAVNFIENVPDGQPYFLYLAPTAPHLPAIPAKRHLGAFRSAELPRSPAFIEHNTSDKPRWLRGKSRFKEGTAERLERLYRRQLEMLLAVDEMIGALVEELEAQGERDETHFIFTSDHGLHYGEHRLLRTKLTPYDASAHIPLVISGPQVPQGRFLERLVLNTDIAPTVAALTGVATPSFVDGRSLLPLLKKRVPPKSFWRRYGLLEFWTRKGFVNDNREIPDRSAITPTYRALRSERYLYTEYQYANGTAERELYDLKRDPFELQNLVKTARPPLLAALSEKLRELRECEAQACRHVENSPLDNG